MADWIDDECLVTSDVFVCGDCPNGICGLGENHCNCAADCGYKVLFSA